MATFRQRGAQPSEFLDKENDVGHVRKTPGKSLAAGQTPSTGLLKPTKTPVTGLFMISSSLSGTRTPKLSRAAAVVSPGLKDAGLARNKLATTGGRRGLLQDVTNQTPFAAEKLDLNPKSAIKPTKLDASAFAKPHAKSSSDQKQTSINKPVVHLGLDLEGDDIPDIEYMPPRAEGSQDVHQLPQTTMM